MRILLLCCLVWGCHAEMVSAQPSEDVPRRTLNNGQLILENVPEIPADLVESLNRYQQVRGAIFQGWTEDGTGIYITTRFADVMQLHLVDHAGGARRQLTFLREPLGFVARRPRHPQMIYGMDQGGNENSQLYLFDPSSGDTQRLTEGRGRNTSPVWQRDGSRFAFQSTRRDRKSNDIWIMDPKSSAASEVILPATDGSWWGPLDWDRQGGRLLVQQMVSANDSRLHWIDLTTRESHLLIGATQPASRNLGAPQACWTADEQGILAVTDQRSDYAQLMYIPLSSPAQMQPVTQSIPWDVEDWTLSEDRRRGAFVVNENGMAQLYLLDAVRFEFCKVEGLPPGLMGAMGFSPDGTRLALTLNTPQTSSDVYTLELGEAALEYRNLTRWTFSEVGGLDTGKFSQPSLVHYPTFDEVDGQRRTIPAFVYAPQRPGKYPVIIFIHGGPESQFRPAFSSLFQSWIDELQVAVIAPNVRGSSGYGSQYLQLDNGKLREGAVRDIGALLDWIQQQPGLDSERVAVYGGSYGGYMVLACAVHFSDRLRAAVDVVGISNFVTFLEHTEEYRRDLRRVEYGDERDAEMRQFLQEISPLQRVGEIRVPLLVVQGQNDPRVPVSEAEQMVTALREKKRIVWYMNALNEGHGYNRKENRDVFGQAAVMFLQKYLLSEDGASGTRGAAK